MTQPTERAGHEGPRHPIQVVSKRTGISADVLRAWEKRHAAVEPTRSDTGRRLYSDEDIDRLSLLRKLTDGGRRIGDIARLPLAQLAELAEEDGFEEGEPEALPEPPLLAQRPHTEEDRPHLPLLREALREGLTDEVETLLPLAISELSTPVFLHEIGAPFLRDIGVRWRSGDTRLPPEKVVALGLRLLFGGRGVFCLAGPGAPGALFVPWGGAPAEMTALLGAIAAGVAGWRSRIVPGTSPPEALLETVLAVRPKRLVLSLNGVADERSWASSLGAWLERVPEDVRTLAIGIDRPDDARVAEGAGLETVSGLERLVAALGSPEGTRSIHET